MEKIAYIGNDMQFGIPLLIVLGSLFTTWTTSFLIFALTSPFYWHSDSSVNVSLTLTLFTVLVSNVAALYYGVKLNNPKLVRAWYTVKIIECVSVVVAIPVNAAFAYWRFDFIVLIGLLLIPFGVYLILCVKEVYKNMPSPNSVYQETIIEPITSPKI